MLYTVIIPMDHEGRSVMKIGEKIRELRRRDGRTQEALARELGITAQPEQLRYAGSFHIRYEKEFHGHMFRDNEVTGVYVYAEPVDIRSLALQESEVDEVRWFSLEEVWNEIRHSRERFCVPTGGLEVLRKYLRGE